MTVTINVDRQVSVFGVGTTGYQSDVIFPRGNFSDVQIRLKSDEELGILDSDYVEDYNGTDGYMTLRRISTGDRVSYPIIAVPLETPGIGNDVFEMSASLATLENEVYALEGRVRDIVGNYTIFGAVAAPIGGERVLSLTIEIVDGFAIQYSHNIGAFTIRAAQSVVIAERAYAAQVSRGPWTGGFDEGFGA